MRIKDERWESSKYVFLLLHNESAARFFSTRLRPDRGLRRERWGRRRGDRRLPGWRECLGERCFPCPLGEMCRRGCGPCGGGNRCRGRCKPVLRRGAQNATRGWCGGWWLAVGSACVALGGALQRGRREQGTRQLICRSGRWRWSGSTAANEVKSCSPVTRAAACCMAVSSRG